jgi:uncharacterized UBP type Zn finger protein
MFNPIAPAQQQQEVNNLSDSDSTTDGSEAADEACVQRLIDMGFADEQRVRRALINANNDVNDAAALLVSSLQL